MSRDPLRRGEQGRAGDCSGQSPPQQALEDNQA
jgi:hypothetical protein